MISAPARHTSNQPGLAMACLIAAMAAFTVQDVIFKLLSDGYPVHQALVIRSLLSLPLLVVFVWLDSGLSALRSTNARILVLRGAIMFCAYTAYYVGLAALPLATSMALYFVAPIFVTILAALFLKEAVGFRRWSAVMVSFAGVLVIVRPGTDSFEPAMLLPLFAGFAYAISAVMARGIGGSVGAPTMVLYSNGVYLMGGLVLAGTIAMVETGDLSDPSVAFLLRPWTMPEPLHAALFLLCGAISAIGAVLLTHAYRIAPASAIAPFEYSSLIWATLLGWFIWRDWPDQATWAGIAIVIACGLYVVRRGTPPMPRSGPVR